MDTEIKFFIKEIAEKTGVKLSVYDFNGNFLAGEKDVESIPTDFSGIKAFSDINKTLFCLKYKSRKYFGAIDGVSKAEQNYAYLIGELAESVTPKDYALSRGEFNESLLLGELNPSQIAHYMRKFGIKDHSAFVMIISVSPTHYEEVKALIENIGAEGFDFVVESGINQFAFVRVIDEQNDGRHSANEYAEFLRQSIYEESGAKVRIAIGGTVNTLAEICASYTQALSAVRMCNAINSKGEIHSYKEFVLIRMLEDLPKQTLSGYLDTLMDTGAREIFDDEEMVNTAEEFLENSLNVSETSRKLYLHRNTLTYRLDKIEKSTGLDIRKFSDAVTFRLITVLSKLVR